tara:strand:+ start:1042 stop:1281 length:240 start_codon:yes stop_codon:yes gene_type:complete
MGVQGFLVEAFQSNVAPEDKEKMSVWVLLLALLVQLLLNALVGQWLWNNSLVKLVPNLKKARWWDTIALAVLFMIVLPQ